jgi:hypothetical protein
VRRNAWRRYRSMIQLKKQAKPMNRQTMIRMRALPFALLLGSAAVLSGCSSSSSLGKIQVGPIAFTDANGVQQGGTHTSISAGVSTYVDVALANDTAQLGVDWTVACGSAPPPGTPLPPGVPEDESCGSFTPVHTASAPVPQYATSGAGIVTIFTAPAAPPKEGVVTLYAAATADHSRYSTVTLTILGLPISIAFAPGPPSSLPVSGTASLKAVLTNDYAAGGVNWTVTCGSSACGSLSAAKTASGVATTLIAPAAVPVGGSVTVTATSVTDPTKSVSANIAILPVTISVLPATLSVAAGGTGQLTAIVVNDVSSAGVDWSLSCASSGMCGSITSHTASGTPTTYTAPTTPPTGGAVTVTAASTANPMAASTAAITVGAASQVVLNGSVMAGHEPVSGASIYVYAAGVSGYGSASTLLNASPESAALSREDGSFIVMGSEPCPSPSSQIYLVADSGNAGGGVNSSLAFMEALGPCDKLSSLGNTTVNEASTVASAYALSGFLKDATHLGAPSDDSTALASSFALVNDLVNSTTGEARNITPAGNGQPAQSTTNMLSDMLNRCAQTSGGESGDGSACGNLFAIAGGKGTGDTLQATLYISRHATASSLIGPLYELLTADGPFEPVEEAPPLDWRIALRFTGRAMKDIEFIHIDSSGNAWIAGSTGVTEFDSTGAEAAGSPFSNIPPGTDSAVQSHTQAVDISGNLWVLNLDDNTVTEFIGGNAPQWLH